MHRNTMADDGNGSSMESSNISTTSSTTHPGLDDEDADLIQYYKHVDLRMWQVYSSMLLVVGTLGNLASIVVLNRRNMRRSNAAVYLEVLSANDLVVLYTAMMRYWLRNCFHLDIYDKGELFCKIHRWLVYVTTDTSVWVIVALTFERLVSVFRPYKVKRYCTRTSSFLVIGVTIVTLTIVNSHLLLTQGRIYETGKGGQRVLKSNCDTFTAYKYFNDHIWVWIDMGIYSFVPLVIISVANAAIVTKVFKGHRHTRPMVPGILLTSTSSSLHARKPKRLTSMTCTLLVLNTVLMVTTLPVTLYVVTKSYFEGGSELTGAKLDFGTTVVRLLMYTGPSVDFLLYCISGSRFREELWAMFHGMKRKVLPPSFGESSVMFGKITPRVETGRTRLHPVNTAADTLTSTAGGPGGQPSSLQEVALKRRTADGRKEFLSRFVLALKLLRWLEESPRLDSHEARARWRGCSGSERILFSFLTAAAGSSDNSQLAVYITGYSVEQSEQSTLPSVSASPAAVNQSALPGVNAPPANDHHAVNQSALPGVNAPPAADHQAVNQSALPGVNAPPANDHQAVNQSALPGVPPVLVSTQAVQPAPHQGHETRRRAVHGQSR